MTDKEKWLNFYKPKYENGDADQKVLKFIADVIFYPDQNGKTTDIISSVFTAGYCYYFANMLQSAFQRGEVCWSVGISHIVWVDTDGVAYDANGIYDDYVELRPVSYLGNTIVDFIHNGETYTLHSKQFKEWCEFCKVTEIFAITDIWQRIPKEELKEYDKDPYSTVETAAFDYWMQHQREIQEIYVRKHTK